MKDEKTKDAETKAEKIRGLIAAPPQLPLSPSSHSLPLAIHCSAA